MQTTPTDTPPVAPTRKVTRQELAIHFNVSQRYIDQMIARRAIPVIRLGKRCVRFDLQKVEDALSKLEVKAS